MNDEINAGYFLIQALGGQIGQFIESAISDAVNVLGHLTGQLDAAVEEVRTAYWNILMLYTK